MSYSNDRDDIAEIFGSGAMRSRSGYSEEVPGPALPAAKTAPPPLPTLTPCARR